MPHTKVYKSWIENKILDHNVVNYMLNLRNSLKLCQELAC